MRINLSAATANGTAKSGSDYIASGTHTLSFLPGEVSKTVTVDLVNDGNAEAAEYFDLKLSNAPSERLVTYALATAAF